MGSFKYYEPPSMGPLKYYEPPSKYDLTDLIYRSLLQVIE
jgi:hypothetical protein